MQVHLVVVKPFDGFSRGDIIVDQTRIASILASEHARFVVRIADRTAQGG